MKHLKTYEEKKYSYQCSDFRISLSEPKIYFSQTKSTFAIFAIGELIRKKSPFINDEKFKNITISELDKKEAIESLTLTPVKIDNLRRHTSSSAINSLIGYKKIPSNIYMDIVFDYYPILKDAIINSNTFGELIPKYEKIYNKLIEDIKFKIILNKYNL